MKQTLHSAFGFFSLLWMGAISTSCSPSGFFGSDYDKAVLETEGSRKSNFRCSGLNLSSSTLDVPTARQIVACFNSNQAIDPLWRLSERLTDAEFQPLVDFANRYLLNDKQSLYETEATFYALRDRKILDQTFKALGQLLESEELVASTIAIMKGMYLSADRDESGVVTRNGDLRVLRALERLSKKMTVKNVGNALDIVLALSEAPSFQEIQKPFVKPKTWGPERSLRRDILEPLKAYLTIDVKDPKHVQIGDELVGHLIDGKLFGALDEVMGTTPDQILANTPKLSSFMKVAMHSERVAGQWRTTPILDGMTSIFHFLNGPVNCMLGAQSVDNAALFVVREMTREGAMDPSEMILRKNLLMLKPMNSLCEFPPALAQNYGALMRLAETPAMGNTTALMKAFEKRGMTPLLINLLGDTGSVTDASRGLEENTTGIKRLLPLLGELADREVWDDLILLTSLPRIEDRAELIDAVQFLNRKFIRETSSGGVVREYSLLDVMSEILAKTEVKHLYNLIMAAKPFFEKTEPFLAQTIRELREAYYVNDAHPMINMARQTMAEASSNREFYNTLLKVSDFKEFKETIAMFSRMASNGELIDLIASSISLYHQYALAGKTRDIQLTAAPPETERLRHQWSSLDIARKGIDPIVTEAALRAGVYRVDAKNDPCRLIDLEIPFADYSDRERFEAGLEGFAACLRHQKKGTTTPSPNQDIADVITYLRTQKLSNGDKSAIEFLIDQVSALGWSSHDSRSGRDVADAELVDLTSAWLRTLNDRRFYRSMDALPLMVPAGGWADPAAVFPPLLESVKIIMDRVRPQVRSLLDFGATLLRRPELPAALRLVETLADRQLPPDVTRENYEGEDSRHPTDFNEATLKRWLNNWECISDPREQRYRVKEIIRDARDAVTNWELLPNGQPRYGWDFKEFKKEVEPLLLQMGNPANVDPKYTPVQAVLNFTKYFTLPAKPGVQWGPSRPDQVRGKHYAPEFLAQFISERSKDYRPVLYFRPGEEKLRVRLVNTIDALEMILVNADFEFMGEPNYALKFLQMFGQAWGDEPSRIWPEDIQDKYKKDRLQCDEALAGRRDYSRIKCPPNLQTTFKEMMAVQTGPQARAAGYPKIEVCKGIIPPPNGEVEPVLDRYGGHEKIPLEVRAALFNINMLIKSLEANLPNAPGPFAGGMKVFRDLAYEMNRSSLKQCRDPKSPCNNIRIVTKIVRLGITHLAGQMMSNQPNIPTDVSRLSDLERKEYEAILDFFRSFANATETPELEAVFGYFTQPGKEGDAYRNMLWKVLERVFKITDDKDVAEQLRKGLFYSLASTAPGQANIVDSTVRILKVILPKYRGFLVKNVDQVEDALKSDLMAKYMRLFYLAGDTAEERAEKQALITFVQQAVSKPSIADAALAVVEVGVDRTPFDVFLDRFDLVTQQPAYRALDLEQIGKDLLHFINREPVPTAVQPNPPQTARRLLNFMADRLQARSSSGASGVQGAPLQGDIEELLGLVAKDPAGIYRILEMMSNHTRNGNMNEFTRFAHCSLDPKNCPN